MAEQHDTNAAIWKSEQLARSFAAQSEQREAQRREQFTLLARLLPFKPGDAFTFLDLGAGTGAASRGILSEYPLASAVLGEYSPQMAAEGERAMSSFAGRYRYVELDMLAPEWPSSVPFGLDAVVSALSIHHLPDDRKSATFRAIFEHLSPGAWYLNYDPIRAPSPELEEVWQRVNDRYEPEAAYQREHRTHEEQVRYENHVRYMIPLQAPVEMAARGGLHDGRRVLETAGLGDLRRDETRLKNC